MDCEVTLYVSGKTFKERMVAKDYDHAKQIALARNPGARVISVNAVFDRQPARIDQPVASLANSSRQHQVTNGHSVAQPGGCAGLLGLALLIAVLSATGLWNNAPQPVQKTTPQAPVTTEDNQQSESSAEPQKTDSYYNQPLEQITIQDPAEQDQSSQDSATQQLPSWQGSSFQNQLNQEQSGQ